MSTWGLLHVLHCVQPDATLPGKPKSSMLAPKSVFWVRVSRKQGGDHDKART
jgi:hypothetical protein